jgi:UDP:flavonoid glycosyltransferase YjiC (YdhE family)
VTSPEHAGEGRLRALFVSVPLPGHFNPLVPIARCLLNAGHDAAFATTDDFCDVPAAVGFDALSFGPAGTMSVRTLFDHGAIDRLFELALRWDAGVVVHDHVSAPAAVAGDRAGIPNAYVSVGIMRSATMLARIHQAMAPLWITYELPIPPCAGLYRYLYIDRCPPSLQPPEIASIDTAHAIQPTSFDDAPGIDLPGWLTSLPPKPTVYVTLGTQFNARELFDQIISALCDETNLNVVVTVGLDNDPASLGLQPPHIRVERYIPQSAIMPLADLVICHGGSGAIMGALTAGLPMLLLPQGADQIDNAPRCVERGVARALSDDQLTPAAIQEAARVLLQDPSYKSAAADVAAEIRRLPETASTVPLFEQLARTRLPVVRN